jgi:N-acetylmuramoyl-L-alanine amidase
VTLPSPNFGDRRGRVRPTLVVIHYTGMKTCAAARARLCDPAAEVSTHWLIDEGGAAEQLVDEALRAWHAGAGEWGGLGDVNSRSIDIELANPGDAPFPLPQMRGLERVLAGVMERWGIPPQGVIGHSDMAPGRKRDPGARFDWLGLARAGLAVWPAERQADKAGFRDAALAFGYPAVEDALLLAAFRLRFRPWATGPVDALDAGMAADLAARYAVDQAGAGA